MLSGGTAAAYAMLRSQPPLILASASPRRRELLASSGIAFQIVPSAVDEQAQPGEWAQTYVRRLALAKAEAVAHTYPDAIVLGADTIVTIDHLLLGKPNSPDDARRMLCRLSGRVHEVVTGVAIVQAGRTDHPSSQSLVDVATSRVRMRSLTAQTIAWYLATGEPTDKAGSYAIQGLGAALVEWVEGSYTNVVGLPLTQTLALLKRAGITADG